MTGMMGVGRVGMRGVDMYRFSTCWQKTQSKADLQSSVGAQRSSHNTISNTREKNLSYIELLQLGSCWAFESFKLRKREGKANKFNLLDPNNRLLSHQYKKS